MEFTRYRVEDAVGIFLDEFSTNAEDVAQARIAGIKAFHPDLKVTQTPEDT